MPDESRQRNAYQLTINNPQKHGFDHETIKRILIDNFSTLDYYCMADEIGELGTPHTHLYVHTTSRVRWSKYKKHFPDAHIEDTAGSAEQNRDYIRKTGKWTNTRKAETSVDNTFEEWGDIPKSKGLDPLMRELYRLVDEGYSNGEIVAINNDYILHLDTIDKLRKMILQERYKGLRRLDLKVHYIFGESGTGKTRFVLDKHGDGNVYRVTDYNHPYDSYNSQDVICYDEFRSSLKMVHMLDALDIYPLELPARYSNRYACYNTVYIVSNWSLEDQYKEIQFDYPSTWKAFLRRIHTVTYFGKDGITTYNSVEEYLQRDKTKPQPCPNAPQSNESTTSNESDQSWAQGDPDLPLDDPEEYDYSTNLFDKQKSKGR